MEHDAWFFVGVFVFIFLIWIIIGGPTHPIAFTGPTLAQPQELGGGSYLSLPRAPFGLGTTNIELPGSSEGGGAVGGSSYTSGSQTPDPLSGIAFGTPSPYRGLVSLNHYVSGAGSSNPNNEYLQLYVSQSATLPIDITGWTVKSEATGNGMTIPVGIETPTSGTINATQDIILKPGTQAYLISGRSPIGGSFRENKCIGYFAQFQNFSPSLSPNCPAPSDELHQFYPDYIRDTSCIDYVNNKVNRCQAVLSPPVGLSGTCQSFLIKYLNYNGCVDAHQNDSDFFGDTWRIYLGADSSLWRTQHEVIKLLDKDGKTVDAFTY